MKKHPLLLIPGLACDREVWRHQIENLRDLADPIFVADLSSCTTIKAMTLAALNTFRTRRTRLPMLVAGHSMGGVVALELAIWFSRNIKKLCILSTTADSDTPEKQEQRINLITKAESGHYEQVARLLADLFTHREDVKERVFRMLLRNERVFVQQQRALLERRSLISGLAGISAPTLVILGEQDRDFPEPTREIARRIPNAKLELISNCGHMSPMEQPYHVTKLMRKWIEKM